MPWEDKTAMRLREEFVQLALNKNSNISSLCESYGISRKTAYKWINRFKMGGPEALTDQSKVPHALPTTTPQAMLELIFKLRIAHPTWGGLKIRERLLRDDIENVPSATCIQAHLKKQGYVKKCYQQNGATTRFEHDTPNSLWQMDFKGHFAYGKGRCHPLTVLDDHSRFSILLEASQDETGLIVKKHLKKAFKTYGCPERINVDNGAPWGSIFSCARYTTFSIWLIEHGIKISYSRPRHPQTNGKIERFHRTLKEEVISNRHYSTLSKIQREFILWRDCYNLERPHQGIDMQVPAERYQQSYKIYEDKVVVYEYADDYLMRRVNQRGQLSIADRKIFVGVPFSKKALGVRAVAKQDGLFKIYYRHQQLGEINVSNFDKKTLVNLYSKRILCT